MSKRPYAVFDIDGTLIRWQLYHAIVHQLGKDGQLVPGDFETINEARMSWKNRRTDQGFHEYEDVLVKRFLVAIPHVDPAKYDQACRDVFDQYKDQTFTYTRDLVRSLKAKGYLLFAVSGSPQEVIELLAEYHGFEAAVGCVFERVDGRFTGEFSTPIFDKRAALDMLVAKFAASTADSYAVGDSMSDVPLLQAAKHPIAFNPDLKLFAAAKDHGWPVVVERKNVIYDLGGKTHAA